MDILLLVKALIQGVVEGLTEFLPISSTGHLIVTGSLLNFHDEKAKVFEIVILAGAILAICWEYRAKLIEVLVGLPREPAAQRFALNLLAAFMPLAVLGLLFGKMIKTYLFNAPAVATAFIGISLRRRKLTRRRRARSSGILRIGQPADWQGCSRRP